MNEAVVIPGFDPFMATNDGYIFNGETGKKLTTQLDKQGYEKLTFRLHGQKKNMFVHRLVALTFIPNPDCKTQINHINGIKTDNSAANLEWCTPSENIKHAYRQGLLHQDGIPIIAMSAEIPGFGLWFPSSKSIRRHGFDRRGVYRCLNGHVRKYRGFIWMRAAPAHGGSADDSSND